MWVRNLKSGQQVSYDQLPFNEVVSLAHALDEWDWLQHKRTGKPTSKQVAFWDSFFAKRG